MDTSLTSTFSRRELLGGVAAAGVAGAAFGTWGLFGARAPESAYAAPAIEAATTTADPAFREARAIEPYALPYTNTTADRAADIKRLLVVVDYQVDFVNGGVFGSIEPAIAIEDALCDKIREYQQRGDLIIYTMDTHPEDIYAQTREGQVNDPHCIPGTPGWELYGKVGELLNPENAIMVMKGTYGSKDLPFIVEAIRSQGTAIESIEFAGVSTTCRVLHNAIILYNFFPEVPMIFDAGTTASYTDERTTDQLDELESWGFIVKR